MTSFVGFLSAGVGGRSPRALGRITFKTTSLETSPRTSPTPNGLPTSPTSERQKGGFYLSVVVDLYSGRVVGWSMSPRQDRQLVIQAVLMALWQRTDRSPVVLHSDRGCQFTSDEYQRFLKGHQIQSSMSAVGSCADNAAAESFFGLLKRERVNRRQYRTRSEARADVFDYIERFHNPRRARKIEQLRKKEVGLTQPSVETG